MQEIRHENRTELGIQMEIDRLAGEESEALSKMFGARRKAAIRKAEKTGGTVTIREARRIRRNDPCPCGSNVKFKKCCGKRLASNDERVKE